MFSSIQGTSLLRQMAEPGVDTNVPDAHGRVGSIQGLANRAALFDEHTLHWAVRYGANAALTEVTAQGERSWLSMDFGEATGGGKRTERFWHVLQTKVNTALRKVAKHQPSQLGPTLERMAMAPVHEANAAWFVGIKARYLGTVLDVPSARKSVPRPRM